MSKLLPVSLLAAAALCLLPATVQAAEDDTAFAAAPPSGRCDRPEALSNLQRKIVDQASQGAVPLIGFVHRTRMVYRLDVYETVAWLEQRRAARLACGIAMAGAVAP